MSDAAESRACVYLRATNGVCWFVEREGKRICAWCGFEEGLTTVVINDLIGGAIIWLQEREGDNDAARRLAAVRKAVRDAAIWSDSEGAFVQIGRARWESIVKAVAIP